MSHLIKDKDKLLARVRRLNGQLEAVERAFEADAPCSEVLNLVASIRGAVSGLTSELVEDHIIERVLNAPNATARSKGAAELIAVMKAYVK
jgi:DNA-binding FrmR family transcriptional regulator